MIEAIEKYEASLIISQDIGDRRGEAHALRGLGYCMLAKNNAFEAIDYFFKATKLAKEINIPHSIGYSNLGLGQAYQMNLEPQYAIGTYTDALEALRQIDPPPNELLNNLVRVIESLEAGRNIPFISNF